MAHSNQVREFVMTDRGIALVDVSRRADGRVAIGSARSAQQLDVGGGDAKPRRTRGSK